jgi:hypothetical protein
VPASSGRLLTGTTRPSVRSRSHTQTQHSPLIIVGAIRAPAQQETARSRHTTYRALSVRIALDRADFYRERLGARERLGTNDAKWLNYIMDREAIQKFLSS